MLHVSKRRITARPRNKPRASEALEGRRKSTRLARNLSNGTAPDALNSPIPAEHGGGSQQSVKLRHIPRPLKVQRDACFATYEPNRSNCPTRDQGGTFH